MARGGRALLPDCLRGAAILQMLLFHGIYDLRFLGALEFSLRAPAWRIFHGLGLGTFVLVAGASLYLFTRHGIRWDRFRRQEAILILSALALSLATWLQFGDRLAYFGVLHFYAIARPLALPLRHLRTWNIPIGLAVIVAGATFTFPGFDSYWLNWIGFAERWQPRPVDHVSLLPWFGVFLIGFGLAAQLYGDQSLPQPRPIGKGLVALQWIGRHSLLIYLVHQPILFALLLAILQTA